MKVLLVGGTGIISTGVAELAIKRGMEVYVLNRGLRSSRLIPGCKEIIADYRGDEAEIIKALGDHHFDVVADFLTFTKEQLEKAVRIFKGRTEQYIFISSGTVYKKPLEHYIITEDAPKGNYHSTYARNKLACERALMEAYEKEGFPGVIVRPSLTYSDFTFVLSLSKGPYSLINRMRRGKQIIVQGDGNSLWTITHNSDFAKGFVGLFGNKDAIGEDFHITTDEVLDWNRIYTTIAHAAGVEANIIHIATDFLGEYDNAYFDRLAGDHSCSAVFDNSKIKRFVPDFKATVSFAEGAKRVVDYFDADPAARAVIDTDWDAEMDDIIYRYTAYKRM